MEKIQQKIKALYSSKTEKVTVDGDKLSNYGLKDITLRDYQVDGVNWLVQRFHHGHGCILADEMGLGKTCQTISFLVYLAGSRASKGPHLVLSPLSVLGNWQNELARFAPHLKFISYVGDKDTRAEMRGPLSSTKPSFDVMLTTYELCLRDESFLRQFSWGSLVVDEGHRLKNRESLLHQVLLEFDIRHRMLLTGTPVQNNLRELCSLLTFVAPQVFKQRYADQLIEKYADIDNADDVSDLHAILKPFLLRRIKSEVVKDLPSKTELVMYHGLSVVQKKYYKAILTKDLEAFENPYQTTKTRLMNILMQLRKCVNHPYLFDGVEPEPFQLGEHLVEASGKLVLIDQLLSYLHARGHKVLMFSQMTRVLDILQDYLGFRGYSYERLDGSVRGEERYLAVRNFNADDDTFIFLLSTKAGGQGLNLVSADTVIFVDSDFNPQNDLQAAARAHRIGQTRPVKVIRLIGRSTVEEIILRRAEAKLKLTHSVIEGGQFSSVAAGSSKEALIADTNLQLQDILKYGVDKLFANEEESTLEEVNFSDILGPTVDGEWQVEEKAAEAQATLAEPSMEVDDDEDKDLNMYEFEGKDYSKEPSAEDKKVFDQLIAVEKAVLESSDKESRALRKHRSVNLGAVLLPDLPTRKPRKQLSPEEKEARRKKREEAAARRAKQEEEEEVRRAQQRRQIKEKSWDANDYTSCNIGLASDADSDEDEEEDEEEEKEEEQPRRRDLEYVVGDVTHPKAGDDNAVVVHCVDDSGKWGVGGLFSAIAARSDQPEEQYKLAGRVRDLALGDAHLIPIDDKQSRDSGSDYLALVVAQHRDRKQNLSGIKLTALSQGLQRIYKAAKAKKASVHLPRIGHNTPGFNWYGTERLIRKHLASRGVPTYIYYYPRKHAMKRKGGGKHDATKHRRKSTDASNGSKNSADVTPSTSTASPLPSFMEGTCVHFHALAPDDVKRYTRLLVAYDGDMHRTVEDSTTHLVTTQDLPEKEKLVNYAEGFEDLVIVSTEWLEECFKNGSKLTTSKYQLSLD